MNIFQRLYKGMKGHDCGKRDLHQLPGSVGGHDEIIWECKGCGKKWRLTFSQGIGGGTRVKGWKPFINWLNKYMPGRD